MTEQKHLITPPQELVQKWIEEGPPLDQPKFVAYFIADRTAQWSADQGLETCCEWLEQNGWFQAGKQLRAALRSKPPSLKEQALDALFDAYNDSNLDKATYEKLFHAFEQLFAPS